MNEFEEQDVYTPVHVSLIKEELPMGCERTMLVMLGALVFSFIVIFQKPLTIAAAVLMLIGGIPLLQFLARKDPQMSRVWLRHFGYQSEYPAMAPVTRIPRTPREQFTA